MAKTDNNKMMKLAAKRAMTDSPTETSNKMWGGRFSGGPATIMQEINASIGFDKRLAEQDIACSRAHAEMLGKTGVLSPADVATIQQGLDQVASEIMAGTMVWQVALEDIHMHIETRLHELIGDPAKRLHTARSRNDQVATDFKLWVRDAIDQLLNALRTYQQTLVARAAEQVETILPGFTHLQVAQPVSLAHHLLAYVEMAARDAGRLRDCRERLNECPLGAAALAGTSYPIDRQMTATVLGFARPTTNSLDSVSDRDFAMEFLSACAITAVHLSRLAEEMIIWASQPFGFISLPDAFSTGSSIMPQKRNPDAAELVRAKAGQLLGLQQQLAIVMKGLPLAYSKDMQEDKPPVFAAFDTLMLCLAAMSGMAGTIMFNPQAMTRAAGSGFSTATDLADWLVQSVKIPFRDAHHITGQIVRLAEERGCDLQNLPLALMQAIDGRITVDIFEVLSVQASIARRTSLGGTAPVRVKEQIARWQKALA